jgi:hypothetical protein
VKRKRLGQALALIGAVFAVFGLYRLGEAKPITAGDGRLARLLLDFLDPMTATLVESYSTMVCGALVAGLGLYLIFGEKS